MHFDLILHLYFVLVVASVVPFVLHVNDLKHLCVLLYLLSHRIILTLLYCMIYK